MKKRCAVLLLGLMCASGPAFAILGTIDAVPAATLLLPYFEVDSFHPKGLDTFFSINNAGAQAVLAHVTIWTDQAVPALSFDVYLTGYDVQTVSLYDVLVNGDVPVTAPAGQDPMDKISPWGPLSQDVDVASCSGLPYQNPVVSPEMRAHVQAWLRGRRSPLTDDCAGSPQLRNDGILRGYVTIDTVNACSSFLSFPSDWASYGPLLTSRNALWGDALYVNPAEGFAQGGTLVAIEACATCFAPGDHTFYGRYNSATAADGREALPTTMAARFVNGGLFNGGTSLLVWRETGRPTGPYFCGMQGPRSWYPLDLAQVGVFDEEEQVVTPETCPEFCEPAFRIPNAAQRMDVSADLRVPFDFGWVYLNLQQANTVYQDPFAQMWAVATMDADGRFSVGFDAVQIDNANTPVTKLIPQ